MKKINELTLKEKIGQLIVAGFAGPKCDQHIDHLINSRSLGNIILFTRNIKNIKQLHDLDTELHKKIMNRTGVMPFITIDQEGGMVTRIMDEATFCPGNMTVGATKAENAYIIGQIMGDELAALGINMNLAPSLDVNNNPINPVIGVRSYSDQAEVVAEYGINFIKGLQEKGIIATAKHFPGHGDTSSDSHKALPTIPHSKERLEKVELYPFKKAIEAGVDAIMSAHVFFEAYETGSLPATLSKIVLHDLLRERLGYDGLIISDCMEMKAIDDHYTAAKGALMGLLAGLDMVIISATPAKQLEAFQLIEEAVLSGEFPTALLDQKVERILRYKEKSFKILEEKFFKKSYEEKYALITKKASKDFSYEIVEKSFTKVSGNLFYPKTKMLLISTEPFATTIAEDELSVRSVADVVKKDGLTIDTIKIKIDISDEEIERIVEESRQYEQIVICTYNAIIFKNQAKLVKKIEQVASELFVISTRNPFDYLMFPEVKNYYCLYEYTPNSVKVISKFLSGNLSPLGKLPISLDLPIKIGASIYVGLNDYPLEKNLEYLDVLKKANISLVFISAHMPEMNKEFYKELKAVLEKATKLGIKIILDVSKPMMKNFEIPEIYALRLDYGFNNDEILELYHTGNFVIELNASTVTEAQLRYFLARGMDLNKIRISHNFYPKPFTGLSYEEVMRRNDLFHHYGLTVMGYIPSFHQKRPPLYEGLPTVELHRNEKLENILAEMHLLKFDEVFFGDAFADLEELKKATEFRFGIITLPLVIKKGISEIELALLKKIHRNRLDESEYFKRSSVRVSGAEKEIAPIYTVARTVKSVTIDNMKFARYQGEVSVVTKEMPADERVNVVGRVVASDFLIAAIKPGMRFKFEIVGVE